MAKLDYGVTKIDLADGLAATAVLALRENFNAHGFDVFTLYIDTPSYGAAATTTNAVTFFRGEKERYELTVAGGADCLLHDFRLLRGAKAADVRLIIADRAMGRSYADVAAVTFETYALKTNAEGVPGRPRFYFERMKKTRAKEKYCDVGKAFEKELGLISYRKADSWAR